MRFLASFKVSLWGSYKGLGSRGGGSFKDAFLQGFWHALRPTLGGSLVEAFLQSVGFRA